MLLLAGGGGCRRRPAAAKAAPGERGREPAAVETDSNREAREKRATAVAGFPVQAGAAVEGCPVLLAPDYGAPRSGTLESGAEVRVVLVEPGFFGIRLPGLGLAFVPARCVRLVPEPLETPAVSRPRREIVPQVRPLQAEAGALSATPSPGSLVASPLPTDIEIPAGAVPKGSSPPPGTPLAALPAGAEPPVLMGRVEPTYPDLAKRMRLSGEVVLRVIVEADGRVGAVDVVSGAPAGMTAAAVEAVKKWTYRPARVDGQPVAVMKEVRVRFSLEAGH